MENNNAVRKAGKSLMVHVPIEVNPVTHFGVISLFSSNFQHFNTFCPLFQKLLEINVKFKKIIST
jgi:hypothetical protein